MLMEISVYPFDYKFAVSWARARARVCVCNLYIDVGDDDNEKLYTADTINGNCPTLESDINIYWFAHRSRPRIPLLRHVFHPCALISE